MFLRKKKKPKCDIEKKHTIPFNPLRDDKILDWSKLKQIADDMTF